MAAFKGIVSFLHRTACKGEGALLRVTGNNILPKVFAAGCASHSYVHIDTTLQLEHNVMHCPFRRYHSHTVGRKLECKISKGGEVLRRYATLAVTEKDVLKRNLRYPNVLIKVEGFDEAVLDSYCQFINSTSAMLGLEVTKQFNLATKPLTYKIANPPDSYRKRNTVYNLKNHGRMIQIEELPVEHTDIFLEHIQINSPEGVKIQIELKTWQDFVSPPDPRLVEQRRQEFERKKAIEIERRRQKSGG